MLFSFGIILLIIGVFLAIQTQQQATCTSMYGVQIPTGSVTVYPYLIEVIPTLVIGVIIIVSAFTIKEKEENTQSKQALKIHFHTLRYWKASGEYEKTGDIYAVKDLLGHKSLMNTDRYQHSNYTSDEYITKRLRQAKKRML